MPELAIPRLVIHPKLPTDRPDPVQDVIDALENIGLLGDPDQHNNTYLAGEEFLNLITFLGCSPSVKLSPAEGDHYCYLQINPVSDSVRCLGYTDLVKPQCPSCKQSISHWKQSANWFDGSATKTCELCGVEKPVQSFRWRKEAGFGQFSIHISYIHPHEVVPSDIIFQALQQASGFSWAYFYANNQDS
ncbi:MAG: hypothetical protein ACN4GM_04985 [Gammaproteobacteria bacterium]